MMLLNRTVWIAAVVLVFAAQGAACAGNRDATKAYKEEIEAWKAHRVKRVSSETGYLALTGLFWVDEDGKYSFGSDPSNDFVFPGKNVPSRIGTYERKGNAFTLSVAPGVQLTSDGRPFAGGPVKAEHGEDEDGTVIDMGTMTWWLIRRGDRYAIRLRDTQSPILAAFKANPTIDRYPTSMDWRVEGHLETYDPPKFIDFVDVNGITSRELCAGAVVFERGGQEYRLDVTREGDEYFIIFGDKTNGFETYGGGRFLYIPVADENGRVTIDFNKCYSPWCAYTDFTTCQLPPQQNRLPIEVTAGEKNPSRESN